jgi:tRNA threonylcarbamoyladenosine biosynthesis protein TsaB
MIQLVAIDCSTNTASIALLRDGELVERRFPTDNRQSDAILPGIDSLLQANGVRAAETDAVAVAVGPGAFTGVRLAIAAAQGLALAWDVPVIPISTLKAMASQAIGISPNRRADVLALLDARMGEVYAGWFRVDGLETVALGDEFVIVPDQLSRPEGVQAFIAIGQGFAAYEAQIVDAMGSPVFADPDSLPTAADVARLAAIAWPNGGMAPESIEAAYLRNKVALTSAERAKASESR